MKIKSLLRIVTSICFVVSLVFFNQTTTFADVLRPNHEYNFDFDRNAKEYGLVDSGSQNWATRVEKSGDMKYDTGYNGMDKSLYFNRTILAANGLDSIIPKKQKSIRFKMKKEASTFLDKPEIILGDASDDISGGFYVGIGSEMLKQINGNLNAKAGSLYIASFYNKNMLNFEIETLESICNGQWHDILFTWDGTTKNNSVKLYVDDMTTPVAQTTAKYDNTILSTGQSAIGGLYGYLTDDCLKRIDKNTDRQLPYNGYLDNIQIYNTVISPTSETTNLKAIGGVSKVDLTWDAVTDATSYTIRRAGSITSPYYTLKTDVTGTSFTDTPVDNGRDYYYMVSAIVNGTEGVSSAIVEATTKTKQTSLKATGGNSKVDLTWDAVTDATSYTIKRSTTAGGPYETISTDVTGTTYTDTNVTNGTNYYYIITAIVAGRESGNSNEASATPETSQTPPTTEAKLKVVLEVAETLRLSVDDDLNVNTQMVWTSSDESVATVNEKGIVTALAPGNTVITVKSVDGSYTDYINVLVVENADDYRLAIDLKIGETARLTADDFTNTANITWAPMDSSIANVTSKGKVTALSKGLVLISAKDADGNIIGRVYVRVRE